MNKVYHHFFYVAYHCTFYAIGFLQYIINITIQTNMEIYSQKHTSNLSPSTIGRSKARIFIGHICLYGTITTREN